MREVMAASIGDTTTTTCDFSYDVASDHNELLWPGSGYKSCFYENNPGELYEFV